MSELNAEPLSRLIENIEQGPDGIWRSTANSRVSYPDQGHDTCHGVEDDSFWFIHRNDCIEAVVRNAPPDAGLPFADIGGGNGYVAKRIADLDYRVILIEPGHAGILHAKARGIRDLVEGSIVDLDVAPGAFGAIGLFDVLEHIEDDAAALLSLRRMLAEGGKLYATVPAHGWLWSSVDLEAGHYRRYTTKALGALLSRCGFDVDLCSYYFWPLPPLLFLFRSLPEMLRLRRTPQKRAQRVAGEHRRAGGLFGRLLSLETVQLRSGRGVPFGASCIVVATRRPDTAQ